MSFISVGFDYSTGALLTVGGVRVLGLRDPVTLDVGGPNNPRPKLNPTGGPKNPPRSGPPSQAAPTNPREVTAAPPPIRRESPPLHAEPAHISAPQNEPGSFFLWGG